MKSSQSLKAQEKKTQMNANKRKYTQIFILYAFGILQKNNILQQTLNLAFIRGHLRSFALFAFSFSYVFYVSIIKVA